MRDSRASRGLEASEHPRHGRSPSLDSSEDTTVAGGSGNSIANSQYIGRVTSRATALASKAQAIRLSTMAWPETISITMMNAVMGPAVVAARNPTMPSAINGIAAWWPRPVANAMSCPMPAPIAKAGANKPAATPLQAENHVAQNLRSV